MRIIKQIVFLLRITRSHGIARRYFVTNGFDGALAMLGLIMGFYVSGGVPLSIAISACLGTTIALAMSGITSAYISESAERLKELRELEQAMISDLNHSAYGKAARLVPVLIAMVNGFAPFLFAILIILPLWLAWLGLSLPLKPLQLSIAVAFVTIFFLGIFIGRVGGVSWLWSGLRTILIAFFTSMLILLVDIAAGLH
jgi:predicted membrane protein (TIGR00267 family)